MAAAGALLVALSVAGLWSLLGEAPEETEGKPHPRRGEAARSGKSTPAPRSEVSPREPLSGAAQEPAPEGVLEVEVHSGATTLEGAQVQLYAREPADLRLPVARWSRWGGGETSASGRWEVALPPGSYSVAAHMQGLAPGYATLVQPPGPARTRVRLLLEAGTDLRGTTVVRGSGEPVSFAEVVLTPASFSLGAPGLAEVPEEESPEATSSAEGDFQLPGLAPGRYRVEAHAPGYVSAVLASVPVPFGARLTLELSPGGQLEGVVLQADGQPAEAVEVLAAGRLHEARTVTDGQGRFSLEAPPDTYAVLARQGGQSAALEREVELSEGQRAQGLRLQLGAGAWLSGTVLREGGAPVLGARVEARRERTLAVSAEAGTDEHGTFQLPALAPGTYEVRVLTPEGSRFEQAPLMLAAGEHASVHVTAGLADSHRAPRDFNLRPLSLPALQGRVLNPRGVPVQRLHVDFFPSASGAEPTAREFMGDRFELSGQLPSGPSQLMVTADGVLRASVLLELKPGEHKSLELPVFPGVPLVGRLVDEATHQPVAGMRVQVEPFGSVTTAQDGRFAFRELPAGELFLHLYRQSAWVARHVVRLSPEQANDVGDLTVPAP
jgi:hypothetical protein